MKTCYFCGFAVSRGRDSVEIEFSRLSMLGPNRYTVTEWVHERCLEDARVRWLSDASRQIQVA
jgi:hypothetical protein